MEFSVCWDVEKLISKDRKDLVDSQFDILRSKLCTNLQKSTRPSSVCIELGAGYVSNGFTLPAPRIDRGLGESRIHDWDGFWSIEFPVMAPKDRRLLLEMEDLQDRSAIGDNDFDLLADSPGMSISLSDSPSSSDVWSVLLKEGSLRFCHDSEPDLTISALPAFNRFCSFCHLRWRALSRTAWSRPLSLDSLAESTKSHVLAKLWPCVPEAIPSPNRNIQTSYHDNGLDWSHCYFFQNTWNRRSLSGRVKSLPRYSHSQLRCPASRADTCRGNTEVWPKSTCVAKMPRVRKYHYDRDIPVPGKICMGNSTIEAFHDDGRPHRRFQISLPSRNRPYFEAVSVNDVHIAMFWPAAIAVPPFVSLRPMQWYILAPWHFLAPTNPTNSWNWGYTT